MISYDVLFTANDGIVHLLYHWQHKKNNGKINKIDKNVIKAVIATFEALILDPIIVILAYLRFWNSASVKLFTLAISPASDPIKMN